MLVILGTIVGWAFPVFPRRTMTHSDCWRSNVVSLIYLCILAGHPDLAQEVWWRLWVISLCYPWDFMCFFEHAIMPHFYSNLIIGGKVRFLGCLASWLTHPDCLHYNINHSCQYFPWLTHLSNHRIHYCTSSLSTDIETNPGPALIVDPDNTIMGPFSQGNVAVFGRNAG